jgi:hypothetical protein
VRWSKKGKKIVNIISDIDTYPTDGSTNLASCPLSVFGCPNASFSYSSTFTLLLERILFEMWKCQQNEEEEEKNAIKLNCRQRKKKTKKHSEIFKPKLTHHHLEIHSMSAYGRSSSYNYFLLPPRCCASSHHQECLPPFLM